MSFSGFVVEEYLPALQSMLEFSEVAIELGPSTLVWRGLIRVREKLTPQSFLKAITREIEEQLASKEQIFNFLTSVSMERPKANQCLQINGAKLHILFGNYPARYNSRYDLLKKYGNNIATNPESYCKVIIEVKAKSPSSAVNRAFKSLDLQRAFWCLMGNSRLKITFGKPSLEPINVVRVGREHTLHFSNGEPAFDGIWFEPEFAEASPFRIEKPRISTLKSRLAIKQISESAFGEQLTSSLIKYVRALDHIDANTAFLRLWGAIEGLTSPGQADYDKVVRRCAFLFKDSDFHRQILEHLREFRNENIHKGEYSENARIHCFQLQYYYVNLIWFHIHNAKFFKSLNEANTFLDSSTDRNFLKRKIQLARKALHFIR